MNNQTAILRAAREGRLSLSWVTLPEHSHLEVTAGPVRLDGVIVTVTAQTAQWVADVLGVMLTTPAVEDSIARSALVVPPKPPGLPDGSLDQSLRYSAYVDEWLAANAPERTASGMLFQAGKVWAITNAPPAGRVANYGFFARGPNGFATVTYCGSLRVLQPLATAHNASHHDYSQQLRLMRRRGGGLPDRSTVPHHEPGGLRVARLAGIQAPPAPSAPSRPVTARTLKQGLRGDDVAAWQRVLGVDADGVFGPATDRSTRAWQSARGLEADGLVGPATLARAAQEAGTAPPVVVAPAPVVSSITFRQAVNYTRGRPGAIDLIVIHSAECAETATAAEALQAWAAGPTAPKASWHYAVDVDSVTQSVRDEDTAWHAPGVNERAIGVELAGRASQSPEQWADAYSVAVLQRAAQLFADLCRRHNVPVKFVGADGLVRGERGITTHAEVSKAFKRSTHTDPGAGFPLVAFLQRVAELKGDA